MKTSLFFIILLFGLKLFAQQANWQLLRMVSIRVAASSINTDFRVSCLDEIFLDEKMLNDKAIEAGGPGIKVKVLTKDKAKCQMRVQLSGEWKNGSELMQKSFIINLPLTDEDKNKLGFKK